MNDGSKGSLGSIKKQRAKKKSLEAQLAEVKKEFEELRVHAATMEERLARYHATMREVVNSVNTSNVLLSSVEKWLDENHGEDWDGGIRKEVERTAERMKERKALIDRSQDAKEMRNKERTQLAFDFWAIARDVGTRAQDVGMVIALLLQSKEVNRALDIVEEVRRDEVKLPPEIESIVQVMIKRCAVIAQEQADEVAAARVARVPTLVDPKGRPISSD